MQPWNYRTSLLQSLIPVKQEHLRIAHELQQSALSPVVNQRIKNETPIHRSNRPGANVVVLFCHLGVGQLSLLIVNDRFPKPSTAAKPPCGRSAQAGQVDDFVCSDRMRFSGQNSAISQLARARMFLRLNHCWAL